MTMAARWSSEFTVSEHRDLQASAMAVDWTGVYVLLAGRRYLAVKNLNDPSDALHKVPRHSKYEVGAAQWNPSSTNKELCAISSNQRVEILSWSNGDLVQTHSLRAHTRVISDLNWHRFDPNLLASCSIDTFIHIWDVRDQRRPALSLSAVAGASQVRWNRLSRYLLATAHDGDVKLWDQRKGTAPVQYIAAHLSKIHGLDWSPNHENQLATSSQDCTVKFFDITNPRRAENILTTSSPVWRARYTPFGEGMVTVVVPQLRRGENSLLLWKISNPSTPVHTFVGHTDVVLEFEWRRPKEGGSDYELITWSKDQSLRIWRIEYFLQKLCGSETNGETIVDVQQTEETSVATSTLVMDPVITHPLQTLPLENDDSVPELINSLTVEESADADREVNPSPTQPKTLQQEFSLLNINIPNVRVEAMDVSRRSCTVTAARNAHIVILLVTFPPNYPYNAAPSFQFGQGTTFDSNAMAKVLKAMKQTAQQRVRKNKSCLEPCLRQLVTTIDQITSGEDSENKVYSRHLSQPNSFLESSNIFGSFQDAYIPFPRTSGGKFCGVDMLVCFGRAPSSRRLSTRSESFTPRSLSALGGSLTSFNLGASPGTTSQYSRIYPSVNQGNSVDTPLPVSPYYFPERTKQTRVRSRNVHGGTRGFSSSSRGSKKSTRAVITVYDASALFFVHRELGEKYILGSHDVPAVCQHNSSVAASVGRRDLVQTWSLAGLAATPAMVGPSEQEDDVPWSHHPFGRQLVESLIAHYAKQSDIQTAAMLCCIFSTRPESQEIRKHKHLSKSVNVSRLATGKWWLKPGGSPYHTIHQVDTSLEGSSYPTLKQNRSNSWSDSLDDFKFASGIAEHREHCDADSVKSIKMLDEKNTFLYDMYKKAYAEILHRWCLLGARTQVLKYLCTPPEPHRGVEFFTECTSCNKQIRGPGCSLCKRLSFQCVICRISVRGSSNFCLVCGHGGHMDHMKLWFESHSVCPTGCGCSCLAESASILET